MELFTGAYGDNLQAEGAADRNRSMQNALDGFMNGLTGADRAALERVALTVVALEDTDDRAWAGHRQNEVHFSGSLVKLLAMYAAHTLRFFSHQLLLEQQPSSSDAFFLALSSDFDQKIKNATPSAITIQHGSDPTKIVPAYRTVLEPQLDAAGRPIGVEFTFDYRTQLRGMLLQQQNAGAAASIHGVAFGFMNAKAGDDGFFRKQTQQGIWLAGDYLAQWTPVRIASANDGQVAQATTAVDMAKLVTRMFDGSLESGSPTDLVQMLVGGGRSWFHRELLWPNGGLSATHAKIGIGPLKPNSAGVVERVVSEALKVHDSNRNLDFVVVWQNLKVPADPTRAELERVSRMVEATINGFQPTV
ncbi:hypothetical protein OHA98_16260 [Streptomyces sp. NBC_00654]|uniref:hypothetical protein n=1 Tax=Streptomyces sp. NBC_00654 TaxID=2975799 RepID=UPI00225003BA|nr:hypothetical protein [Streptomyces sp. NBC_00654]MCX4966362.1 hypothetical protein [Streptomyces sp. NBC_00654]